MTGRERWIDAGLAEFTRAVAARGPVPASGSVAALLGALGAGLASMALTTAEREDEGASLARRAAGLAEELLACIDEDARAYGSYLEARGGRGDLAGAVEASIAVPEAVASRALAALGCLEQGLGGVRTRLHSEAVTATRALLAALESATFTARANLPGLADAGAREERRAALVALGARGRALAEGLLERIPHDPA